MMSEKQKEFYIDIDAAIQKYNDNSPLGTPRMTRRKFSEMTGIGYQTLVNYQGGLVPALPIQINIILEKCGMTFDELLKTKE